MTVDYELLSHAFAGSFLGVLAWVVLAAAWEAAGSWRRARAERQAAMERDIEERARRLAEEMVRQQRKESSDE